MPDPGRPEPFAWARAHGACCSVTRFEEGGCKAMLPKPGKGWVCLSGTRYQKSHSHNGPLCDLLFFLQPATAGRQFVAVLELKGGRVDVSEVGCQLQGAATVVEGAIDASGEVDFVPLLVHRGLPTMAVNRLRSVRVRFRGAHYRVRLERCGLALA